MNRQMIDETMTVRGEFFKFCESNIQRLFYLRHRWQDERLYEDFADYQNDVRAMVEEAGFEFKGWTKNGKLSITADGYKYLYASISLKGFLEMKWLES